MRRAALAVLLLAGCGTETCRVQTALGPIDVVSEMPGQGCSDFTAAVQARAQDYAAWNPSIRVNGWTAILKPLTSISGGQNGGMTHWDTRVMEIEGDGGRLRLLVHELEHIRLGPDSALHCGWLSDGFAAWQLARTGLDERAYDTSTCPGSP